MIQRTLPIYQTGWFYLLLLFWGMSASYISNGGFNQANQLNINLLNYLAPAQEPSENPATLVETDILTLQSSFYDSDISAIKTLLSYHPNSQITLLGQPSKMFMKNFEGYFSSKPRSNKVIIASDKDYSGKAVKIESSMMLSSILNWFRFSQQDNVKQINSEHFIYSPLRLNKRQSYPLLWQHQSETYLSLPAEILKQLTENNELLLNQSWHLNLTNSEKGLLPELFSLGFFGEVFTNGKPYSISQYNQYFPNDNALETSVSHYLKQRKETPASGLSSLQYKVIIITDGSSHTYNHQQLKPLLIKLTQGNYLSQNILTILLSWIFAAIGLVLIYLIRQLPLKQQ